MTAEMVLAILEGRKTQFREVIKPQPTNEQKHLHKITYSTKGNEGEVSLSNQFLFDKGFENKIKSPYRIGDEVFVKEDFQEWDDGTVFMASNPECSGLGKKTRPAAHMNQRQSRITLKISNISVERLQDISEDDCSKEGSYLDRCECLPRKNDKNPLDHLFIQHYCHIHGGEFRHTWNSVHKKPEEKFEANPFVWKIEFEVVK